MNMSIHTPLGTAIAAVLSILGLLVGGTVLARYANADSGPTASLTATSTPATANVSTAVSLLR
jgi:hypothetical protein